MKRRIATWIAVFATWAPGSVVAKKALKNPDIENKRPPVEMLCSKGDVLIGVIYNDLSGSDATDGVGVVCLSPRGDERTIVPSDMGAQKRVTAKCNPQTERVVGVAYKDRATFYKAPKNLKIKGMEIPEVQYRKDHDAMDGVTVVCQDRKSGATRIVEVPDLAGGRDYVVIKGKRAIGIQYRDLEKSDEADGVTLVVE